MFLEKDDVTGSFAPAPLGRARSYLSGRITRVRLFEQGEGAEATVQGAAERPYLVRVSLRRSDDGRQIESECSCPEGTACEHAAALALLLLDRISSGGASDDSVDAWTRQVLERSDDAIPQDAERLHYTIDVTESYGLRRMHLEAFVMPGTDAAAKPRPFPLYDLTSARARFITNADLVAGRLVSASGLLRVGQDLSLEVLAMLLAFLARRGNLRWRDPQSPPLQFAPLDGTALTWETGSDGLVRAMLAGFPQAVLLPTTPLWYVDPQEHRAGVVVIEGAPDVAAAIGRAPVLSASQAQRAQIALHRALERAGIEGPAHRLAFSVNEGAPRPVLRLSSVDGGRAGGTLFFEYGEQLVRPRDPRDSIRIEDGENLTVWPRNRSFERTAEERLARLDFPPFGEDAWLQFLERDAPQLRFDGWKIETTPSFPFRIVEAGDDWSAEAYDSGAAQWFELELGIDVDGTRVSLLPVLIDALGRSGLDLDADPAMLARRQVPFVGRIPGGGYVALPADRVARVLATLGGLFGDRRSTNKARVRVPALQAAAFAAAGGIAMHWSNAPSIRAMLADLAAYAERPVEIPAEFAGELRPYQRDGVAWLQTLKEHRAGGILADDMGLGKTVEVLAHVAVERAANRLHQPVLVVSPTSVAPNWRTEIARFLPSASVLALTGADRSTGFALAPRATFVLTT